MSETDLLAAVLSDPGKLVSDVGKTVGNVEIRAGASHKTQGARAVLLDPELGLIYPYICSLYIY